MRSDDDEDDEVEERGGATEHSDVEDNDADAEIPSATEHCDGEDIDANAEMIGSTEHPHVDTAGASEHTETEQETIKLEDEATDREDDTKPPPQTFQLTTSLRDDWLHRGDALQDMDLQTYAESLSAGQSLYVAQMRRRYYWQSPLSHSMRITNWHQDACKPSGLVTEDAWRVSTYPIACERTSTKAKKTHSSKPSTAR